MIAFKLQLDDVKKLIEMCFYSFFTFYSFYYFLSFGLKCFWRQ